jgi:hypothetical protein
VTRDNFSEPVKTALAKRAGFHCSYPGCNATTVGPSAERDDAVSNTGTAAHISAAAGGKGSRRYDSSLTKAQRTSIDNGLWCCRQHGTLIDTDEVTYSSAMLHGWRAIAETKAQLRQAYGDIQLAGHNELTNLGLASDHVTLTADFSNTVVGKAVLFSGVAEIWGKPVADSTRDFLIEYARNALDHGGATVVTVEFAAKGVIVRDDGQHFNVHAFAQPTFGRGGGMAYRTMLSTLRINAISSIRSASNQNVLHFPLVRDASDLVAHNPCALEITRVQLRRNMVDFSSLVNCDRAYVIAPDYMSYSDGPLCELVLTAAIAAHTNIALVIPHASAAVLAHFRKCFPDTDVLSW